MASASPIARRLSSAYFFVTIAPSVPSAWSDRSEPFDQRNVKNPPIVSGSMPVIVVSLPSTRTVSERTCEADSTPAIFSSPSPSAARKASPSLPSMT